MTIKSTAMTQMRDARESLISTHWFYGALAYSLDLIEDSSIPTANITRKRLKYNPMYVESLSRGQRKTLFAHEVSHPALGHDVRMGNKDKAVWGESTDEVINNNLLEEGFEPIPNWLCSPEYKGMSADEIYERKMSAKQKQQEQGDDGQSDDGQSDDGQSDDGQSDDGQSDDGQSPQEQYGAGVDSTGGFDAPGPERDSTDSQESADQWKEMVFQAAAVADKAGKLPGFLKRQMKAALGPKAGAKEQLRRYMQDGISRKKTYSRQNRRYKNSEFFIPGYKRDGIGTLVILFDVSGSITQRVADRFAGYVNEVIEDATPREIHVVYCDTRVVKVESFEPMQGETLTLTAIAGGGTEYRPAFAEIKSQGWSPVVTLYLTDLDCSDWPGKFDLSSDVVWIAYGAPRDKRAPIGETIHLD